MSSQRSRSRRRRPRAWGSTRRTATSISTSAGAAGSGARPCTGAGSRTAGRVRAPCTASGAAGGTASGAGGTAMLPLSSTAAPATATHRLRQWYRRLGRRGVAAAAVFAAAALLLAAFFLTPSRDPACPSTTAYPSYGHRLPTLVELTLVDGANEKGALCLDGTPSGYHWLPGFGEGCDKWLLHLEGGSWCRNLTVCGQHKKTSLGSSDHMERRLEFVGILSDDELQNPEFYNWNKVRVRYCDGASFSGNVEAELQDGTSFFFRGQRIWEAVMSELLSKGLSRDKEVLAAVTDGEAGDLAVYDVGSGAGACRRAGQGRGWRTDARTRTRRPAERADAEADGARGRGSRQSTRTLQRGRAADMCGDLRRITASYGGARKGAEEHAELLRQGVRLCFRLLRRGANCSGKSSKGWLDPRAGLGWLGSWTVACPAFIYN